MSGGPQDIVVSVAELDRRLRRAVENATGGYWVEGEVSSLKRATSGHLYFTLKDDEEDAIVECVMYRFDALRAQRFIKDGEKLQVFGRVTASKYSVAAAAGAAKVTANITANPAAAIASEDGRAARR